jgi:hypothetical protein
MRTQSSHSWVSRFSINLLSAIPPALSATGPYASIARVNAKEASNPVDANATPYEPARSKLAKRVAARTIAGIIVEIIPTDNH